MKKVLFLMVFIYSLIITGYSFANVFYTVSFSESDINFAKKDIYTKINIKGCIFLSDNEYGKPDIPAKIVNLIIPQGNIVSSGKEPGQERLGQTEKRKSRAEARRETRPVVHPWVGNQN